MPDYESEVKKNLGKEIEALESKTELTRDNDYANYLIRLRDLNRLTEEQYEKDDFGLNKPLTPETLGRFRKLYTECCARGNALLTSMKDKKEQPLYDTISRVQKMLVKDMEAIISVTDKPLKDGLVSFQRIIEDSRTETYDISGIKINTVGGAQSSRIPLSFVQPDGTEKRGVFTPKNVIDIEAGYDAIIAEMKKQFPDMAKFYECYKANYEQKCIEDIKKAGDNPANLDRGKMIMQAMRDLYVTDKGITPERTLEYFKQISPVESIGFGDALKKGEGIAAQEFFKKKMEGHLNTCGINVRNAGIRNGSRLDSRNSAMSAVAGLLGVSDIICKAVPMNLVKDGKVMEGTFMDYAQGVDPLHPSEASLRYANANVFERSNGLKSIADLQVIDFICGNVDRHSGNMFYQFDTSNPNPRKHKFIGVQGIDNDSSFGTYIPKNRDAFRVKCVALNAMKVISASMAKALASTTPDMLAMALLDFDLTKKQVEAAKARFTILKDYVLQSSQKYHSMGELTTELYKENPNRVMEGTVRIVRDDKFDQLDIDSMSYFDGTNFNTFCLVGCFPQVVKKYADKVGTPSAAPEKVEDWKACVMTEDEAKKAAEWVKSLKDATNFRGSSPQFDAVLAAAKRYAGFCETNKGFVLSEDLYDIRRAMLRDVVKTAEVYGEYKAGVQNPNDYTAHRIETVRSIKEQATVKSKENYYEDMMAKLSPEAKKRCADGKHYYEDRSLEDFNARMRKMAEEIAIKHGKIPAPEAKKPEKDSAPII